MNFIKNNNKIKFLLIINLIISNSTFSALKYSMKYGLPLLTAGYLGKMMKNANIMKGLKTTFEPVGEKLREDYYSASSYITNPIASTNNTNIKYKLIEELSKLPETQINEKQKSFLLTLLSNKNLFLNSSLKTKIEGFFQLDTENKKFNIYSELKEELTVKAPSKLKFFNIKVFEEIKNMKNYKNDQKMKEIFPE